jgi:hypothetical protein
MSGDAKERGGMRQIQLRVAQATRDHIRAILLLTLTCLGLGLRLYRLDQEIILYDEAFTWRLTRCILSDLIRRASTDVHPPLHYIAEKYWIAVFGDSLYAMRSLSALFGTLSIPLAYFAFGSTAGYFRMGNLTRSEQAGALIAAAFMAINISDVTAGRTARMYGLGIVLALASSAVLFQALSAGRWQNLLWFIYGVSVALFLYTHNFALYSVAAQVIVVTAFAAVGSATRDTRRNMYAMYLALTGAFIVYLPWIGVLVQQTRDVTSGYWIPPLSDTTLTLVIYDWIAGMPTLGSAYFAQHASEFSIACVGTVGVLIIYLLLQTRSRLALYYFLQAAVPWLLCIVTSALLQRSLLLARCFLFAHAFAGGTLGAIFAKGSRWPRFLIVALLAACALTTVSHIALYRNSEATNAISTLQFILSANGDPPLTIVVETPYELLRWDYYIHSISTAPARLLCDPSRRRIITHLSALNESEILQDLRAIDLPSRVWKVGADPAFASTGLPGFTRIELRAFVEPQSGQPIYVALYGRQ